VLSGKGAAWMRCWCCQWRCLVCSGVLFESGCIYRYGSVWLCLKPCEITSAIEGMLVGAELRHGGVVGSLLDR